MPAISKKEADAYDRMLDAAACLSDLIEGSGIDIDEDALEELCVFLARNGPGIRKILLRIPEVKMRDGDALGKARPGNPEM